MGKPQGLRPRLIVALVALVGLSSQALLVQAADLPDISSVPEDLKVPAVTQAAPAPGLRVPQTTEGWQGTEVHHLLSLPADWKPDASWPVLVEYAGNGGYKNAYGDVSDGTVEGSRLGHGLSAGKAFIWVCMPYVEMVEGRKRNAVKWWGDVEETKRYCCATVRDVCARWGGDASRVILCGFSRGSIGCNFIGLHDDDIAPLWRGFFCHSHYDGVRTGWPYAGADRASALARLRRLQGRPQFIIQEGGGTQATETWLKSTGIQGDLTFVPLPYRNHTDAWLLRDIPERRLAREWLARVAGLGAR